MKNFILPLLLLLSLYACAQSSDNMFTELPYGESIHCVMADGNYMWFGTGFGIVKYNTVTGAKQYFTPFNTPAFRRNYSQEGGYQVGVPDVLALSKDSSGNLYAVVGNNVLRYDGFVWQTVYEELDETSFITNVQATANNKVWITINDQFGLPEESTMCVGSNGQIFNDYQSQPNLNYSQPAFNYENYVWANTDIGGISSGDSIFYYKADTAGNILDTIALNRSNPLNGNWDFTIAFSYVEPSTDILWLVTNDSYLIRLKDKVATYYPLPGLPDSTWDYPSPAYNAEFTTAANGDLFVLFAENLYYQNGTGNPPPSANSFLFKCDGNTVTTYDSIQTNTLGYNITDMAFDQNDTLWMITTDYSGKPVKDNVFKKASNDSWSSLLLNDIKMPGGGDFYDAGTYIGSDTLGNSYFEDGGALVTLDKNYNTTLTQIGDSTNPLSQYADVDHNGTVWMAYYNTLDSNYGLIKFKGGVVTRYNAMFGSTANLSGLYANDNNSVYIVVNNDSMLLFDGNKVNVIDANAYIIIASHDAYRGEIEYYNNSSTEEDTLNEYNGTSYKQYFVPNRLEHNTSIGYGNFVSDKNGMKWFLAPDTTLGTNYYYQYRLWKWDQNLNITTAYNPGSNYNVYPFLGDNYFFYSPNDNAIYSAAQSIDREDYYWLKFDGANWTIYPYATDFLNTDGFYSYSSFSGPYQGSNIPIFRKNSSFCYSFPQDLIIYNPEGIPNYPDTTFNTITGHIYYDLNSNNKFDSTDINAYSIGVTAQPYYHSVSDYNGNYFINTDTGLQHISVAAPPYFRVVPATDTVNFGNNTKLGAIRNFALQPIPGINDLAIQGTALCFRPGFSSNYYLGYVNKGTTPQNATVTVTIDSNLLYSQATPPPTGISGNVYTWALGTLQPQQQPGFITITVNTPANDSIGTPLLTTATITPIANDSTKNDNTMAIYDMVTGSFDPNQKTVSPVGMGSNGMVDTSQVLTYTISFQNTGNDTAFNVVVSDTLSANMDVSTLKVLSSSTPVQFNFQYPNLLKFVFQNIHLPAETVSAASSLGFIKYSIKANKNIANNSRVNNTANIFFDYNSPVATNAVSNTFMYGVASTVKDISGNNDLDIKLYPNPTSGLFTVNVNAGDIKNCVLEVTDVTGKILLAQKIDSPISSINLSAYGSSIYFIRIKTDEGVIGTGKLILIK